MKLCSVPLPSVLYRQDLLDPFTQRTAKLQGTGTKATFLTFIKKNEAVKFNCQGCVEQKPVVFSFRAISKLSFHEKHMTQVGAGGQSNRNTMPCQYNTKQDELQMYIVSDCAVGSWWAVIASLYRLMFELCPQKKCFWSNWTEVECIHVNAIAVLPF